MENLISRLKEHQPSRERLAQFSYWHVESLLNQAAELFEKCLEETLQYNSLLFTWINLLVDIKSEQIESLILQKKLEKEFHLRDFIVSKRRVESFQQSESSFASVLAHARKLYGFQGGEGQGLAGWTRAGENLGEREVEEVMRILERRTTDDQHKWANEDSTEIKQRIESKLDSNAMRRKIFFESSPIGAPSTDLNMSILAGTIFDINTQLNEIGEQLSRNYMDGLDRLIAAEDGLKSIYGFSHLTLPEPQSRTVSKLVIWTRTAIEHLVAFQQVDQGFTRVFSLRSIIKNDWRKLENGIVNFRIGPDAFSSHYNVRFRSMSASVVGKSVFPWSIAIWLPKMAVYDRGNNGFVTIDQSRLPKCFLGRVENHCSRRAVEQCGMVSLRNASPIGEFQDGSNRDSNWSIAIDKSLPAMEKFSQIKDILLEINAVGIPYSNKAFAK